MATLRRTPVPHATPHDLPEQSEHSEEDSSSFPELQESPQLYNIRDPQQMVWVLSGNSLISVPASNNVKPVTLTLIACRDKEFADPGKGNLVYLGIQSEKKSLSCTDIDGTPTLQLEDVHIMTLYAEKKAQKPFLFFHSTEGSTSTFQSVSHPGWFIATSPTAQQPVILSQQRGETSNTNFYLEAKY